jgi:phenylacetate-CoA ligase
LAEVAAEEKLDLAAAKVCSIIVAGEPGGSIPATRALIEQLWPGARVVDHHGMTEMGPDSYECPTRRGVLHVFDTAYFAGSLIRKAWPCEGRGKRANSC